MSLANRGFFLYGRVAVSYLLSVVAVIIFFTPVLILAACLPQRLRSHNKLLFWFLNCAYKAVLKSTFVPITIKGKEHLPHDGAAIVVANHESALDIPILGSLMSGQPHVWYVLARFASTPVLGFFVRRMGIPVEQSCSMKSARALLQGIRCMQKKSMHALLFPEGGRYNDGKIHDFFLGFAILAQKTGRPVVPVMLRNPGKVLPPKGLIVYWHPIYVTIGEAFVLQESETVELFSHRVHRWFDEQNRIGLH